MMYISGQNCNGEMIIIMSCRELDDYIRWRMHEEYIRGLNAQEDERSEDE